MVGPNAEPQEEVLSPREKLGWCLENLGQRLTTVGLGKADARPVRDWAVNGVPEETGASVDALYGAAKRVADVHDSETARAFLRSSSPYTGDRSVIELTSWAGVDESAIEIINGAVEAFLS